MASSLASTRPNRCLAASTTEVPRGNRFAASTPTTIAMITIRVGLRAPRAADALLGLHLLGYILDDLLPTGPLAYHVAVRARAVQGAAHEE